MPTKFVEPLTDAQRERLKDIQKTNPNPRVRMRAHAILLSDKHYSIDQISDIYEVDRDRIAEWMNRWSELQFDGLTDDPRRRNHGQTGKPGHPRDYAEQPLWRWPPCKKVYQQRSHEYMAMAHTANAITGVQ